MGSKTASGERRPRGDYVDSIISSHTFGDGGLEAEVPADATHYVTECRGGAGQVTFYRWLSRSGLLAVPEEWKGAVKRFRL